ncbi:MAG: hypothetical protein HBSAPP04_22460 [Ignavibacteriaceae bacterium]|nr:MAG: hypothetical protein HBSAPP04_22460 [Ignavibacteriaceae bacterium]
MKVYSTAFLVSLLGVISLFPQKVIKSPDGTAEGFRRYPLYEEVTNTSCGPCASSNPVLNAYLEQMHDSLVAVTYHAWWPGVNDPMYQHNIQQNRDRIQFMKGNVNATPWLNVDGIIVDVWPFTPANLSGAYNTRMAVPASVGLTVFHQRISPDSVEVTVQTTNLSTLPSGTWKLRVLAIEDPINYTTAPGSNGERFFPHVFRKAVPTSAGENYPTAPGMYQFTYRYKFESAWVDSNTYAIAYVQDDVTKEVLNSSSSRFASSVPVELTSFTATSQSKGILLEWTTASETNNYGFEIEKSTDGNIYSTEAFIAGKGTTLAETNYSYFITGLPNGEVYVRLKQIDYDGTATYTKVETVNFDLVPENLTIHSNYPNPFNPSTVIRYALPADGFAEMKVYNATGELVKVLISGEMPAGQHQVTFDATGLNSGVYFVRLVSKSGQSIRKVSLLK